MSRVRIPLPANQERAYLVWKGRYIDFFGCQHPFCFVDRLAHKSSYVMALMPDRIKVGVRSGLIESITTLWKGQGNPIRVSMICNPQRGLPSRGCCKSCCNIHDWASLVVDCKSWTLGWDSLVPSTVWW